MIFQGKRCKRSRQQVFILQRPHAKCMLHIFSCNGKSLVHKAVVAYLMHIYLQVRGAEYSCIRELAPMAAGTSL